MDKKTIVIFFLIVAICTVMAPVVKQSVEANQKLAAAPAWSEDPARADDCTNESRGLEHLYKVFSVTEEGKKAHGVEDGALCLFDDQTYEMYVRDANSNDLPKSFGSWTEQNDSVFITQYGESTSNEIK